MSGDNREDLLIFLFMLVIAMLGIYDVLAAWAPIVNH
jgi:hypothetical protein